MQRLPLKSLAAVALLALLSACASQHSQITATQEAAQYKARARRDYTPPGPPSDPWGPYIIEAAGKYDVPERWIREVMRQESSGKMLETSWAGAMGLMQVMPATYDTLKDQFSLGDDPYDPHDNIMAGAAYIRQMYDLYGTPGFLAAYNAGPGRLDDYLTRNRELPTETRNYVARIGPRIAGVEPEHLSAANQYAMNQIPLYIPPGPRYPRKSGGGAPVALAENRSTRQSYQRPMVLATTLPEPPPPPPQMFASAAPQSSKGGFHLINHAMADTIPVRRGGPSVGNWAIQVGAFGNENLARAATESAKGRAPEVLGAAHPTVGLVHQAKATLYRARLTGLSRDAAIQACEHLSHAHGSCVVLSPDSQS